MKDFIILDSSEVLLAAQNFLTSSSIDLQSYNNNINDLPKIIYVSHDGDEAIAKPLMIQAILRRNFLPLHPEAALNMYSVSVAHNGKKMGVIEDCLSLIYLCDEFWVMTEEMIGCDLKIFLSTLPEGVIGEALRWEQDTHKPVYLYDMQKRNQYKGLFDTAYHPYEFNINSNDCKLELENRGLSAINHLLEIKTFHLRPVAYIMLCDITKLKYKEWVRNDVFHCKRVPFFPYDQADDASLMLADIFAPQLQRRARIAYAVKANELWLYGVSSTFLIEDFSTEALLDL